MAAPLPQLVVAGVGQGNPQPFRIAVDQSAGGVGAIVVDVVATPSPVHAGVNAFAVNLSQESAIVRSMIQNENEMISQRQTSFAALQGFLFASLGLLSDEGNVKIDNITNKRLITIVGTLGMFSAFAGLVSHLLAIIAISDLANGRENEGVIGMFPSRCRIFCNLPTLPFVEFAFMLGWAAVFTVLFSEERVQDEKNATTASA